MNDAQHFFQQDRFANTAGVELVEIRSGFARTRMDVTADHLNAAGTVHGGALFTLAGLAFMAAASAAGPPAMGINMSIACVHAVDSGTLWAEAVETARSRKLSHCTVRITNQDDALIAQFQGTAYIKDP